MDPRFPVGDFSAPKEYTPESRREGLAVLSALPSKLRASVSGLSDAQLETPYREGGWTVRQVVHHVADSHMNAYIRWRFAMTETEPTIKPYNEADWARLDDAQHAPVEVSLQLLDALHQRWVRVAESMKAEDFARTWIHPDHKGVRTLDWMLALYAWHSKHHTAHITELRKQKSW